VSVSVLIVDDHPVVRTGIRGMLEGQPDFVVVWGRPRTARRPRNSSGGWIPTSS
jgi:DNA-binding NarL/FixJ family response regulator